MSRRRWAVLAVAGLAAAGMPTPATAAPDAPDARFVPGAPIFGDCTRHTDVSTPDNGQRLRVNYRALQVETDQSTDAARTVCVVDFRVERPAGWTFSIPHISFDGVLRLHGDAVGQLASTYYLPGGNGAREVHQFLPPSPVNWHHRQSYRHPALGDCERSSPVRVQLNLTAKRHSDTASAAFAVNSAELVMSDLTWRRCGGRHRG